MAVQSDAGARRRLDVVTVLKRYASSARRGRMPARRRAARVISLSLGPSLRGIGPRHLSAARAPPASNAVGAASHLPGSFAFASSSICTMDAFPFFCAIAFGVTPLASVKPMSAPLTSSSCTNSACPL